MHFVLPFVLAALALMHLIALHDSAGSGNPLGISGNSDRLPFAPYFIFKDLITIFLFILVLSVFVFFMPNVLGDSENYVMANPMQTPPAIVPEWYLLPFYAILRSIPNKLLGVIAMFSALLILLVMPFADLGKTRGIQFRPLSKIAFYIFVANFLILMQLGAKHVESPFIEFGQISTVLYFSHFLIIVPLISLLENSLTDLNKIYPGLERELNNPAKPHAFNNLPLQSKLSFSNFKQCIKKRFTLGGIITTFVICIFLALFKEPAIEMFNSIQSVIIKGLFLFNGVIIRQLISVLIEQLLGSELYDQNIIGSGFKSNPYALPMNNNTSSSSVSGGGSGIVESSGAGRDSSSGASVGGGAVSSGSGAVSSSLGESSGTSRNWLHEQVNRQLSENFRQKQQSLDNDFQRNYQVSLYHYENMQRRLDYLQQVRQQQYYHQQPEQPLQEFEQQEQIMQYQQRMISDMLASHGMTREQYINWQLRNDTAFADAFAEGNDIIMRDLAVHNNSLSDYFSYQPYANKLANKLDNLWDRNHSGNTNNLPVKDRNFIRLVSSSDNYNNTVQVRNALRSLR